VANLKPIRKLNLKSILKAKVSTINEPIITYGEGWISKKIGSNTSTTYLIGLKVEDEFVQEWIKRPY
jgi:hypothetical protein